MSGINEKLKPIAIKNKREVRIMDFYNHNSDHNDMEEYEMACLRYEQYTGDY